MSVNLGFNSYDIAFMRAVSGLNRMPSISTLEKVDLSGGDNGICISYTKPSHDLDNPFARVTVVRLPATQSGFFSDLCTAILNIFSSYFPNLFQNFVPTAIQVENRVYYVSRSDIQHHFPSIEVSNRANALSNTTDLKSQILSFYKD